MSTATEKSKAAVAAIASGEQLVTKEKAREIYLAVSNLEKETRNAEHQAFLLMAAYENIDPLTVRDFELFLRESLRDVYKLLKFVGELTSGKQ
jgi:hypothetical protein